MMYAWNIWKVQPKWMHSSQAISLEDSCIAFDVILLTTWNHRSSNPPHDFDCWLHQDPVLGKVRHKHGPSATSSAFSPRLLWLLLSSARWISDARNTESGVGKHALVPVWRPGPSFLQLSTSLLSPFASQETSRLWSCWDGWLWGSPVAERGFSSPMMICFQQDIFQQHIYIDEPFEDLWNQLDQPP